MEHNLALIEKANFEIVGEEIRDILNREIENQIALALADGQNEKDYSFEAGYGSYVPVCEDEVPIPFVNIRMENTDSKKKPFAQNNKVAYFIDIYAFEESTYEGKFVQGLTHASLTVDRVYRQIIYILMSPKYERLGFSLGGFVGERNIEEFQKYDPEMHKIQSADNLMIGRLVFSVQVTENIPDLTGPTLAGVNVSIN